MVVLREATTATELLLVHAPYPGRLKFQGIPSSLFAAIGPFVRANGHRTVSYLDPATPSDSFYARLRTLLASGRVRAVCVSTSTAAIGETARVARIAMETAPATLVVVGGPHENSVKLKAATRLPGAHLSFGGEAESALRWVLERFLSQENSADAFIQRLAARDFRRQRLSGRFTVTSASWGASCQFDFGPNEYQDPRPLVFPERYPRFAVFESESTIPLMVSRGCPYGRCTFCAESRHGGGVVRTQDYGWVGELAEREPSAALYFQDSIFPCGNGTRDGLLPTLRRLGRPWGCQVFLPMLSERQVAEFADHGCTYLYTGVESGAPPVVNAINKPHVTRELILERAGWVKKNGLRLGVSLMFGVMSTKGELLETPQTLEATSELASAIVDTGVEVAGFYPNVQTVLPGTALAHGLKSEGHALDFYSMPRAPTFDTVEDGGVGYNFLSLAPTSRDRLALAHRIVRVADEVRGLVGHPKVCGTENHLPRSHETTLW